MHKLTISRRHAITGATLAPVEYCDREPEALCRFLAGFIDGNATHGRVKITAVSLHELPKPHA